jgi:hypothetical protein
VKRNRETVMMLKTIHTLCGTLAVFLSASLLHAQPGNWAEPMFEKLDHDFGVVAKGADTKYRLKLVNKLPNPIHILGAGTLCKCASAAVLQDTLAPGETGFVEITLDTRKFEGNRDTTVIVHFDRPQYAEVRIPIKAYIRKDVVLTPGKVEFGPVALGAGAERRVGIAYSGAPNWVIREVINKNSQLEVQLQEVSRVGGLCNYELITKLKPGAKAGELRDQLILVTNDTGNPHIPVMVEGRIEAEYTVTPELVDFGILRPGERKQLILVVSGRKPFTVEKIESEETSAFEVRLPKMPAKFHRLPLTVTAPADGGTLRDDFTITIAGTGETITFKAVCKVSAGTAARP